MLLKSGTRLNAGIREHLASILIDDTGARKVRGDLNDELFKMSRELLTHHYNLEELYKSPCYKWIQTSIEIRIVEPHRVTQSVYTTNSTPMPMFKGRILSVEIDKLTEPLQTAFRDRSHKLHDLRNKLTLAEALLIKALSYCSTYKEACSAFPQLATDEMKVKGIPSLTASSADLLRARAVLKELYDATAS